MRRQWERDVAANLRTSEVQYLKACVNIQGSVRVHRPHGYTNNKGGVSQDHTGSQFVLLRSIFKTLCP